MTESRLVASARALGPFPRARADGWAMAGQDGGQAIALDHGTLLVFSDSLIVPTNGHNEIELDAETLARVGVFRPNCIAHLQGDLRAGRGELSYVTGSDGLPAPILVATPEEQRERLRFWPAHGLLHDGFVHLFYLGIQTIAPRDPWGFRNVGVGVARIDPATGECERVRIDGDWRLWPPRSDDFHFGVHVLTEQEHAYVFGSTRHQFETSALVARVAPDRLAEPDAYEFYDPQGDRWVREADEAGDLGPSGGDFSIAWNEYLEAYVMVYVEAFSKSLAVRVAERPQGPYSPPELVGRLQHAPTSELVYLAVQYPGLARTGGRRILVSYCEPRFAMPSLLEVTFA